MFWELSDSIPAPTRLGRGRVPKYPFSTMAVGQSAFFEGAKTGGKEYQASQAVGRSKGWKFTGRTEEGGLRVWRVE